MDLIIMLLFFTILYLPVIILCNKWEKWAEKENRKEQTEKDDIMRAWDVKFPLSELSHSTKPLARKSRNYWHG